jgi:putative transposase
MNLPVHIQANILIPMGPHRKKVQRFHKPGDCHELTSSCYHRMPLLTNDPSPQLLAHSINQAMLGHVFRLIAFVFMPEHVNLPT